MKNNWKKWSFVAFFAVFGLAITTAGAYWMTTYQAGSRADWSGARCVSGTNHNIVGFVYFDANNNGRYDPGEQNKWPVMTDSWKWTVSAGGKTVRTSYAGWFSINSFAPGNYKVTVTATSGLQMSRTYYPTSPNPVNATVCIGNGRADIGMTDMAITQYPILTTTPPLTPTDSPLPTDQPPAATSTPTNPPVSGVWTEGVSDIFYGINAKRSGHTSVVYNNKMYVYGGNNSAGSSSGSETYSNLRIFDFSTNKWQNGKNNPYYRYSHSAVVYNGKMYVFGGSSSAKVEDSMEIYDFTSDTWTQGKTDTGNPREFHTAAVYGDKMYVYGGQGTLAGHLNTMRIYDFKTDAWSSGPSYIAMANHSAVVSGNKMYLYGLSGTYNSVNKLNIYDFSTQQWNTEYENRDLLNNHTAVVFNGKMYIFGGMLNNTTIDKMSVYDFASKSWTVGLNDSGNPVREHSAVVFNGKMYVFGGRNENNDELNRMRIYDFASGN